MPALGGEEEEEEEEAEQEEDGDDDSGDSRDNDEAETSETGDTGAELAGETLAGRAGPLGRPTIEEAGEPWRAGSGAGAPEVPSNSPKSAALASLLA